MRVKLFVMLVVLLGGLVSCGGPEGALIGVWIENGRSSTIEFFEDGTVEWDGSVGTYAVLDNATLRFTNALGFSSIFEFEVQGNSLTLVSGNQSVEFTKGR